MNFQQLEYIIAVNIHRHFGRAAKSCHVTQPTLSMMVHKLEEELGAKVFDRSKQPVVPTALGVKILEQARVILREKDGLKEIICEEKETIEGELSLGIIPTLAPYLLPYFLTSFLENYPLIQLKIVELTTENIVSQLKQGLLDVSILVTPLPHNFLNVFPLFYEEFYVYSQHTYEKNYLRPKDIDKERLWLLEEGHCLRSQIINLCELKKKYETQLEYEVGSIETLKQLVDHHHGTTILPELATFTLSQKQKKHLMQFEAPAPVREVSLVTHRNFLKSKIINALIEEIVSQLPKKVKDKEAFRTIDL